MRAWVYFLRQIWSMGLAHLDLKMTKKTVSNMVEENLEGV